MTILKSLQGAMVVIRAFALVLSGLIAAEAMASETLYLSDLPPFVTFDETEGRKPHGAIGDLVVEVLHGMPQVEPVVVPFARLTHDISQAGHVAVALPVIRAPSRERHYCWIAPLATDHIVLAGTVARPTGLAVAKKVGVLRGSVLPELVEGLDHDHIDWIATPEQAFQMLTQGRDEFLLTTEAGLLYFAEKTGLQRDKLMSSPSLGTVTLYLVGTLSYPAAKIEEWRAGLRHLAATPQMADLREKNEHGPLKYFAPKEIPEGNGCH